MIAFPVEINVLLKPSRLLTMKATLDEAQIAYEKLDRGEELAVLFRY